MIKIQITKKFLRIDYNTRTIDRETWFMLHKFINKTRITRKISLISVNQLKIAESKQSKDNHRKSSREKKLNNEMWNFQITIF